MENERAGRHLYSGYLTLVFICLNPKIQMYDTIPDDADIDTEIRAMVAENALAKLASYIQSDTINIGVIRDCIRHCEWLHQHKYPIDMN